MLEGLTPSSTYMNDDLQQKKLALIQKYGFTLTYTTFVWIATHHNVQYANQSLIALIDTSFTFVSAQIFDGLLFDTMSVEEAARFFK